MAQDTEQVMREYVDLYTKLYSRVPQDVRALDKEWVIVNGARMRLTELEYLIQRMTQEYQTVKDERRGVLQKMIKWFKG